MKEFIKKNILIISLLIFLIICFLNISIAPLWRDEAFSALVATNDWGKIIQIAAKDTQPPLHLFLLHISYLIAGKGELALRVWSIIGGILTIIFSFKVAGKAFKTEWSKVLIAPIIVFNPILYNYSLEARPYSLFTAFFIGAIYYAICYGENKNKKNFLLIFIFSVLGLYIHNLFVICLISIFLILFWTRLRGFGNWKSLKMLFNKIKDILLLGVLIVVCYLPWLITFISQLGMVSSGGFWLSFDYLNSIGSVFAGTFAGEFYYPQYDLLFYIVVLSVILGVVGILIGWGKELFKNKKNTPMLVFGSLIPLILIYFISMKTPFMYIRYMIFIVPILLIAVVKGFEKAKFLTIIFLITSIVITSSTLIFKPNMKEDYKGAISKIEYIEKTDVILHKNALPVFGFRYYSDLPSYIYSKPEDIRYFEGKAALVDNDYWTGDLSSKQRIWVLNLWQDENFDKKIEALGFIKISQERFNGDLYLTLFTR